MEPITNLPEVQEIEEVRSKFLSVVLSLKVSDQPTLEMGNQLFLEANNRIKDIDEKLDPKKKLAYRAYQEWLKLIEELKEPYIKGKVYLNTQIVDYKKEQDRIRNEEMERQRQEAIKTEMERRKKEEGERLAQAAELEAAGAKEEAEALINETVEEIAKPIEVYIPPPETQKVKLEGATVKEYWHAEVFNLKALCKGIGEGKYPETWVNANMTPLNEQARSRGNEMKIDGVRAVSVDKMAATGRR